MIKYSGLQLADISDKLAESFDFRLPQAADDYSWITLELSLPFTVLARDGTGGNFLACGNLELEERPITFASSEGQASEIANSLSELISMILEIPYWFDILKFSGGGDLSEMRKVAIYLESDCKEDHPEQPEVKKFLSNKLNLVSIHDPISMLHSCVSATSTSLVESDGWKYESMFGNFTALNNKFWL